VVAITTLLSTRREVQQDKVTATHGLFSVDITRSPRGIKPERLWLRPQQRPSTFPNGPGKRIVNSEKPDHPDLARGIVDVVAARRQASLGV
jgi:hypothetical protein